MMAAACVLFFLVAAPARPDARLGAPAPPDARVLARCVFIYARSPYSEALQTLVLMWLVERTLAQGERPTTAGLGWLAVAAGVLVNSKLVYVLFLPLVAWLRDRSRAPPRRSRTRCGARCRWPSSSSPSSSRVALWHNHIKTGSLLRPRLPDQERHLLRRSVRRRSTASCSRRERARSSTRRRSCSACSACAPRGSAAAPRPRSSSAIIAISLVFNAKFRHWHADYCWGPRHLTALTPLALLLAFPWLPEALRARPRRACAAARSARSSPPASPCSCSARRSIGTTTSACSSPSRIRPAPAAGSRRTSRTATTSRRSRRCAASGGCCATSSTTTPSSIATRRGSRSCPSPSNLDDAWTPRARRLVDARVHRKAPADAQPEGRRARCCCLMLSATAATGVWALRRPRRDEQRQALAHPLASRETASRARAASPPSDRSCATCSRRSRPRRRRAAAISATRTLPSFLPLARRFARRSHACA